MNFETFKINGPVLVRPHVFGDDRGYFFESFREDVFNDAVGREVNFIQDNQSLSVEKGTVRGLHYQAPPFAQAKLIRCVAGAIVDIIIDVRKGSPTFGQNIRVELNATNHHQLLVPRGFLHGFVTTEPNSIVTYKVDNPYDQASDGSVRWNSPSLGLDWGLDAKDATLSAKDLNAVGFEDWTSPFTGVGGDLPAP